MIATWLSDFQLAFRHLSGYFFDPGISESPQKQGQSALFFPLVGFFVGLGLAGIFTLFSLVLEFSWACFGVVLAAIPVYGGNRYSVIADMIKGWGMERKLASAEILDNTHSWNVWVIFVPFCLFMLKFLALSHIGKGWIGSILILMPVFSCWSFVYLVHSLAYSKESPVGSLVYVRFIRTREFWGATIFTTAAAILFFKMPGVFLLMLVSFNTALLERFVTYKKEVDVRFILVTVMELNEVWILLVALAMRKGFSFATTGGVWL